MNEKTLNKDDVLEKICVASRIENLGLFIGSGFSKAVMSSSNKDAMSWLELLKTICNDFKIDDNIFKEGYTYPLIASKIINFISESEQTNIDEATLKLKQSIASHVNIEPSKQIKEHYKQYFDDINPQWIITTNYDNVIEQIIGEKAFPILPDYSFYNTKNIIPIYHIHGSILDPKSIVISNEDYAKTLRPSDYRHNRLPTLLNENTILMIGYGLGDLNVLSAIDYRNNVYNDIKLIENCIIQLIYTNKPSEKCYEHNGIIIYEYNDLLSFFESFSTYNKKYKYNIGKRTNKIIEKNNEFIDSDNKFIELFEYNKNEYRKETIKFIYSLDSSYCYIYSQFMTFLNRVFDKTYFESRQDNQFQYYNYYIKIWFDLVEDIEIEKTTTVYLSFLISKLDEIAYYVGNGWGEGHEAYKTLKERKEKIPVPFKNFVLNSVNKLIFFK